MEGMNKTYDIPETIQFLSSKSGDWVTLVFDGENVAEGHSLSPEDILDLLGIPYTSLEQPELDKSQIDFDEDDEFAREEAESVAYYRWVDTFIKK